MLLLVAHASLLQHADARPLLAARRPVDRDARRVHRAAAVQGLDRVGADRLEVDHHHGPRRRRRRPAPLQYHLVALRVLVLRVVVVRRRRGPQPQFVVVVVVVVDARPAPPDAAQEIAALLVAAAAAAAARHRRLRRHHRPAAVALVVVVVAGPQRVGPRLHAPALAVRLDHRVQVVHVRRALVVRRGRVPVLSSAAAAGGVARDGPGEMRRHEARQVPDEEGLKRGHRRTHDAHVHLEEGEQVVDGDVPGPVLAGLEAGDDGGARDGDGADSGMRVSQSCHLSSEDGDYSHGAGPKERDQRYLLPHRDLQRQQDGDGDGQSGDVDDDVEDAQRQVAAPRVEARAVLDIVVPAGGDGLAREQVDAGVGDGEDGDGADQGHGRPAEPLLGRQLQVPAEDGQLGEADAQRVEARLDHGVLDGRGEPSQLRSWQSGQTW